jgi:transcriptional antiterminator RfaH
MEKTAHWYAVYTKPRNEKKLADRLNRRGVEAYLPLRRTLKQWSDRRKMVEEPLISSYVFVNISQEKYFDVLNTPGAVRYIWFSGKPAVIPAGQIQILKLITSRNAEIDCIAPSLQKGSHVKVVSGSLKGLTGELLFHTGRKKVLIRIDHLDKALLLTISPGLLAEVKGENINSEVAK